MAEYLIISSSLNPESRSRLLAHHLHSLYQAKSLAVELIDMREHSLPFCDGGSAYGHPNLPPLKVAIENAGVIVIATPIYNFDANAVIKNLVELTGQAWANKTVGFLSAAGGRSSYMSTMGLANSLMLDFRCTILPRFVYATGEDFIDGKLSQEIAERIERLAEESMA